MKVISFNSARVTWLFQLEEILPLERNTFHLNDVIASRYSFTNKPTLTTPEEMAKDGLTFSMGQLQFENRTAPIAELKIYNDGVVVTSENSNISYAFLHDLINWLRTDFGFRDFSSQFKELCLSEIIVEFDHPLSRLISAYEAITSMLSVAIGPMFGTSEKTQFVRIDFGLDPSSPNVKVAGPKFVLERRSGVPFSQERYFASAPVTTEKHLELLRAIEHHASQE